MGTRFRKSINLGGGLKVNLTKTGVGISAGTKGAHVSVNSKGRITKSVGLPGTGISHVEISNIKKSSKIGADEYDEEILENDFELEDDMYEEENNEPYVVTKDGEEILEVGKPNLAWKICVILSIMFLLYAILKESFIWTFVILATSVVCEIVYILQSKKYKQFLENMYGENYLEEVKPPNTVLFMLGAICILALAIFGNSDSDFLFSVIMVSSIALMYEYVEAFIQYKKYKRKKSTIN